MPDNGIFSSSDQNTSVANVSNNNQSQDPTTGPLAVLVGENRKYKSVEDLAKAYLSADEFIERMKGENSQLREQLTKAKTIDDVLERLNSNSSSTTQDQSVSTSQESSGLSAEDVRKLVAVTIQGTETARVRDGNLHKADAEMRRLYGDKAAEVFAKEATTPELKKAYMDLAAVSPDKFIALFTPKQGGGTTVDNSSSINTAALTGGLANGREADSECKEFYDNLRKKEPAKYYSSAFQLQMNNAAVANPNKFFNR